MYGRRNLFKFSPAYTNAYAWTKLGIENSQYLLNSFFKIFLSVLTYPFSFNKKNNYTYLVTEPRYKAIDYFIINKFSYNQIIELSCGFSPRGINFTKNPNITYIESDTLSMLNSKKRKVETFYKNENITRPNHKFVSLNLLEDDLDKKLSPFINKNEKVLILAEDLTHYFQMEDLKIIFTNIQNFLRKNSGGVYITDVLHEMDVKKSILNKPLKKFSRIFLPKFILDISDTLEGISFLKDCGFDFVETQNPLELSKLLDLKTNILSEKGVITIYIAHVF